MKAVFLDRDGTIGGTGGGMHPFEFSLYDFAPQAIKSLNDLGVKVFLFTNQTRVGRGFFTEDELLQGFEQMKAELAEHHAFLDDIFYCPHHPNDKCPCQKPKIGLLLAAQERYSLQMEDCYVVGDTGNTDMAAAHSAGAKKVLVKTGWGEGSLTTYRGNWQDIEPHYIARDLTEAVEWIRKDMTHSKKQL